MKDLFQISIALVLGFYFISAELPSDYRSCGTGSVINSLVMQPDPCAERYDEYCTIRLNSTYTGYVNFTSNANHENAFAFAKGVIGDQEVEFEMKEDACDGNVQCPIQQGVAQIYKAEVLVASASLLRCTAKFELLDENGDSIVCFLFGVVVLGN